MKVRLSRDPKRLDTRLNDLSRELAQAESRAARAQALRTKLEAQREAILKSMRGRVSELALQYLQSDPRRLAGFRDSATDAKQDAMLKMFFDLSSEFDATAAPVTKTAKPATGKRRGRPPGAKSKRIQAGLAASPAA